MHSSRQPIEATTRAVMGEKLGVRVAHFPESTRYFLPAIGSRNASFDVTVRR